MVCSTVRPVMRRPAARPLVVIKGRVDVPRLDRAGARAREVDLAEADEVLVGRLDHVHDLAALVHDLAERDDLHPVDHAATDGTVVQRSEESSVPASSSERSQRSRVKRASSKPSFVSPIPSNAERSSSAPVAGVQRNSKPGKVRPNFVKSALYVRWSALGFARTSNSQPGTVAAAISASSRTLWLSPSWPALNAWLWTASTGASSIAPK